jgi:hypothetical protein
MAVVRLLFFTLVQTMNFRLSILISFLLAIGSSLGGYTLFFLYIYTPDKAQLSESHALMDKKLMSIIKAQDALITLLQENKDFNKLKMTSLEDKISFLLKEKEHNNQFFPKQENNTLMSETVRQCERLITKIDFSALKNIFIDAEGNDFEAKQRALKVLALLGAPEEKQKIDDYIVDKEQDISLRRDLIKSTDWSYDGHRLMNVFKESNDPIIRTDIIASAESAKLQPEDRVSLDAVLFDNFYNETNDSVKIETLDYFYNTNREQYSFFMNSININELSQEVKQHIQSLE